MRRLQSIKTGSLLLLATWLSACGGGGGSDSPPPSSNNPPASTTLVSRGVITGFGSVHVNGNHFLTNAAAFSVRGEPGTQSDLRVGHFVTVHAHRDGSGNTIADRVVFDELVRGPVQSVDAANASLVVLGQTVLVDADTSFDDNIPGSSLAGILVGDVVEVSGTRTAAGAVQATRLEKRPAGVPYEVTGVASQVDTATHRLRIGALVVDYSTATLQDFTGGQPANGDVIEAKGSSVNAAGEFVARILERKRADDERRGDGAELEGLVTRFVSATDFDVIGRRVTTVSSTVYVGGTAADLAVGVKVEVEGTIDANGVLVASKVDFKRQGTARIAARVDSVNVTAGTLVLLGIDVSVNAQTRVEDKGDQRVVMFGLANISAGDYVEVRGAEMPAGSNDVVATRLERRRVTNEVRLRGIVDSATAPNFSILGVTVQTGNQTDFEDSSAADFFTNLTGKIVSAKGVMSNGVLIAEEVEFEDD